jgi:hypothetical protein
MRHIAKPEHEIAYQELVALIQRLTVQHGLSSVELLAVAANMLGKIVAVALQDQRTMTADEAVDIVISNLQIGNDQAIKLLAAHRVWQWG